MGNDVDSIGWLETDCSVIESEECEIAALAYEKAREETRTFLADEDTACADKLAVEALHTAALGVGIPPVLCTA